MTTTRLKGRPCHRRLRQPLRQHHRQFTNNVLTNTPMSEGSGRCLTLDMWSWSFFSRIVVDMEQTDLSNMCVDATVVIGNSMLCKGRYPNKYRIYTGSSSVPSQPSADSRVSCSTGSLNCAIPNIDESIQDDTGQFHCDRNAVLTTVYRTCT